MDALQKHLGYQFKDTSLLSRALCHASCDERQGGEPFNNERLEFLGDRVLGLVVARMVFESFTDAREGALAKRHTALVRQEALADVARQIDLGEKIRMSVGEERSGGRDKDSILSDAMEAVIAAIYLDGGVQEAEAFIRRYWQSKMQKADSVRLKDAKSQLQEFTQKHQRILPVYEVIAEEGEAHCREFVVKVTAACYGSAQGRGSSKQQAQQKAALSLLEAMRKNGDLKD